ncbi:MAG: hypothetical protein ACR2N9_10185 [Acidimicrobiia bacterium]
MTDDGVDTPETDEGSELEQLRAEVQRLRGQLSEAHGHDADAGGPGRPQWRRRWLSIACAILAAILLPAAIITVWTRNTVLDTDEYVGTVAPLAEDENVQEAVTFRVTEAIAEAADFRAVAEDALPPEAQVLAGPIESGAKSLIGEVVGVVVASDQFAELWEDANRAAHETVVPLLEGRGSDFVATEDGRVVVKLGSIAAEAVELVDERLGTELAGQIPEEELDAELVLVDSTELADAQGLVRLIDNLSWISVILVLALLVGTLVFAEKRRLGTRRLGLAIAVPTLLCLLGYAWARDQYLNGLPADVHNPDAAAATFDILTRFLLRSLRTILALGAVALLAAWVVGPSSAARRVQGWWGTLVGRADDAAADREVGGLPIFVAANERTLMIAAGSLAALTVLLWTHPTGLVVLLIALVTLGVIFAIRVLASIGRRADGTVAKPEHRGETTSDEAAIDLREPPDGDQQTGAEQEAPGPAI